VTPATSQSCDAIVAAMHEGRYERNEQGFMRLVVRPGMHAVDVGAHIGFHTVHLADLVDDAGSVTAFEPVAEHVRGLFATIRERGCEKRVRVVQAGAGDSAGTRLLIVAGPGLEPANAHFDGEPRLDAGAHPVRPARDPRIVTRRVPVVALDDAVSHRPVSFLKIDAEGAEALVLRGARRLLAHDQPVVLVDLHPHLMALLDGTTPQALIHEMAALGYDCRLLGAGVPGRRVTDVHAPGVTPVVFLARCSRARL
jgi:FkbM family methyltransferase